jgi:hypothetical protein
MKALVFPPHPVFARYHQRSRAINGIAKFGTLRGGMDTPLLDSTAYC